MCGEVVLSWLDCTVCTIVVPIEHNGLMCMKIRWYRLVYKGCTSTDARDEQSRSTLLRGLGIVSRSLQGRRCDWRYGAVWKRGDETADLFDPAPCL